MPIPRLEEYQLQFDQIYDGAYRYLDRCGEFMAKVQQAAGFTPLSATPNNCTMEVVEHGLQLRASVEMMVLVCTQPENAAEWIRSAEYCSKQAIELFEPRSIVQNQIISRSIWRTKSLEDSYKFKLGIPKRKPARPIRRSFTDDAAQSGIDTAGVFANEAASATFVHLWG